jgi:hypothetical protein
MAENGAGTENRKKSKKMRHRWGIPRLVACHVIRLRQIIIAHFM